MAKRIINILRARATLALAIYLLSIVPASSQESAKHSNWMFEFVNLRAYAMTLRATGGRLMDPAIMGPPTITPKIVGGIDAGATDNPFQVALLMKDEPDNRFAFFCGGTLIQPNIVVTAAHCSDFVTPTQVQVLSGTRKLDGSGVRHDISRITVHPNWDLATFDNDVAVWKLSSNALGITPATLADSDGPVGSNLLTTGWGALTEGGDFPVKLQKVGVPLVDVSNCNDDNSYSGDITTSMLCAGFDAGGKDACQGDSGGPLTRGTENTVLTGITSWGIGCARENLFGVYTRVSNAGIRTFIENNGLDIDTFSVNANDMHGFHFETQDKHQFNLVSAYPVTENGILTYEWDNVRDPGDSRFIRRLNVMNQSNFKINFKLKVNPISLANTQHSVELDTINSVAANGKHGFHFETRDQHQFYLVSAYPTTVNGRLTYKWDNVRDPGSSKFIRRLVIINKSNFPVTFKLKVIKVDSTSSTPVFNDLLKTVLLDETSNVAANGKHGFHFETRDQHQFYLVSAYPTTVNGRLTYEWNNVRDPGSSGFIRRLVVINKSNFPVTFSLKVLGVVPRDRPVNF
jgi:hypothetical protein